MKKIPNNIKSKQKQKHFSHLLPLIHLNDIEQSEKLFNNQILAEEKLLTKKEIAEFLNVSVKMIDRKVYLNEIPFMKIGRLVRFSKSKILTWAEENNSSR